eukprot:jgi/Bigna1/64266/fgenesh1_kg.71_\
MMLTRTSFCSKSVVPPGAITRDGRLRMSGSCVKYNTKKGWGFIKPKGGGKDIFVHQGSIKVKGWRSLLVGEEVEFEVVDKDGRTEAVNVTGPGGKDVVGSKKPEEGSDVRRSFLYWKE